MEKMKNIMQIIMFCAVMLTSCDRVLPESQIAGVEPPVLHSFPCRKYVLRNAGEENQVLMTAVWTETSFRAADGSVVPVAPVSYSLQMDISGDGFDTPVTVAQTNGLGADVRTREFNLLLLDSLKIKAGEEAMVDFRVLAKYGQSGRLEQCSSNVEKLALVPYQDRDPLQMLYISGDMNDWVSDDHSRMLPMFKENSSTTNHTYVFVGNIPSGSRFVIVPQEHSTTGMMYYDGGDGTLVYAAEGEPFVCQDGGYRKITLNLRTMLWTIEDHDGADASLWGVMGFIGNFCNWENEPLMTRVGTSNPHLWYLEHELPELAVGEVHSVKFRAERSWGSRWAAVAPEEVPFGKTIFLALDEADPNIVLTQGGRYEIYFNDLTGHYAIIRR